MKDLQDGANDLLTGHGPLDADGGARGPEDGPDVRWCKRCEAHVPVVRKGQCPTCGSFLPGNTGSRKHPVNVARRDEILRSILAERRPRSVIARAHCDALASALAELEAAKPGSTEHTRVIASITSINTLLDAAPTEEREPDVAALDDDQLFEQLEATYLAMAAEREQRAISDAVVAGAARLHLAKAGDEKAAPADAPAASAPVAQRAKRVEPAEPEEPRCVLCHKTAEGCTTLKATRLDIWRAIHFRHPDEIKRRDDEATEVMYRTARHGSGITQW